MSNSPTPPTPSLINIPRFSNWETPWGQFIGSIRKSPLIWGQDDCMLMASRNLQVLTGYDVYTMHVGKYDDEQSAFLYLRNTLGCRQPSNFWDELLPRAHVADAKRGDLVYFGECVGICLGMLSIFKDADNTGGTTEMVPTLDCDHSWSIGG